MLFVKHCDNSTQIRILLFSTIFLLARIYPTHFLASVQHIASRQVGENFTKTSKIIPSSITKIIGARNLIESHQISFYQSLDFKRIQLNTRNTRIQENTRGLDQQGRRAPEPLLSPAWASLTKATSTGWV